MNKKQIIVALLAVSCIAVNPVIEAAQPNTGLIARAKKEYKEFKSAFSCVRKSGFHACTPAQKKHIVATGGLVISTVLALAGVGGLAVWKLRQPRQAQGQVGAAVVVEPSGAAGARVEPLRVLQQSERSPLGNTALQRAINSETTGQELQRLLARYPDDLNVTNNGGNTPLDSALIDLRVELVRVLLEAGGSYKPGQLERIRSLIDSPVLDVKIKAQRILELLQPSEK